ncbi:dethiobiotin synthase [Pedobacter sp. LMG 31464]|uniref:ATP-dependent dethiobiotin synthetase BioD n=1 Tax=Pedobacter planticolens TaxID=2679964 RepID=A0A923DXS6_9SPHI|nr:dethiobiotin synthase [Pedobacter planticolens]MBB2144758.1 dethiobiotin synthase [Pedobacter planticolens]
MAEKYFVTGIGTGIGKTLISAILTEKLKADYWKPIQSGDLAQSDSLTVKNLISNSKTKIHPETYRLNNPLSPHLSARLDGIQIELNQFHLPKTDNSLIIEGAGGLLVPLNDTELILDLIKHLNVQVIVVSQNYLGSINHTLLTINTLKQHNIIIKGIIFNGETNSETEDYILKYTQISCLGRIPLLKNINKQMVIEAGKYITL